MGKACYICLNICDLLKKLTPDNWIDIAAIVVNAGLGFWIVKSIQNNLTNKRVLKDHFITEVKEIRDNYKEFFNKLFSNQIKPRAVLSHLKLMNIKLDELTKIATKRYKLKEKFFEPYQVDLSDLITNNPEYISHFQPNTPIVFSDLSKLAFIRFQQINYKLFNEAIVAINDAR